MSTRAVTWVIFGMFCAVGIVGTLLGAASAGREASPTSQQPQWREGTEFEVLNPRQSTQVAPGKIEVVEVFWYSCPHCYLLEPHILRWEKTKPAYIEFVRMPVTWTEDRRADARLYYTLRALKREDLHQAVFNTIHVQQHSLTAKDPRETVRLQVEFATRHGIDKKTFMKALGSPEVEAALANAEKMTRAYRIAGVPSIVVNGRYTTDIVRVEDKADNLMALVNYLAERERSQVPAQARAR